MEQNQYFFCYNRNLQKFLTKQKSIRYIVHGIHPRTRRDFYLFHSNEELSDAIEEYKSLPK